MEGEKEGFVRWLRLIEREGWDWMMTRLQIVAARDWGRSSRVGSNPGFPSGLQDGEIRRRKQRAHAVGKDEVTEVSIQWYLGRWRFPSPQCGHLFASRDKENRLEVHIHGASACAYGDVRCLCHTKARGKGT